MKIPIKNTLVALAILLFFPGGIILMWAITTWNRRLKWAITAFYSYVTATLIFNHFVPLDPLEGLNRPNFNITDARDFFNFITLPVLAVMVAIATKGRSWKAAIVIASLSVPICLFFIFHQYSDQAKQIEFGGLGDFFACILAPVILGLIALIVSLIPRPKGIKEARDR